MREIKFRAWNFIRDAMGMVESYSFKSDGGASIYVSDIPRIDGDYKNNYYLMQYTGLKDKNGKEVYEGDVVEIRRDHPVSPEYTFVKGIVKWNDFTLSYSSVSFDGASWTNGLGRLQVEVLGNIYENPELIK